MCEVSFNRVAVKQRLLVVGSIVFLNAIEPKYSSCLDHFVLCRLLPQT